MFKKASKSVCTSTTVESPGLLSPTPSPSSVTTPKNTGKNPDAPESADEGETQLEYSPD